RLEERPHVGAPGKIAHGDLEAGEAERRQGAQDLEVHADVLAQGVDRVDASGGDERELAEVAPHPRVGERLVAHEPGAGARAPGAAGGGRRAASSAGAVVGSARPSLPRPVARTFIWSMPPRTVLVPTGQIGLSSTASNALAARYAAETRSRFCRASKSAGGKA